MYFDEILMFNMRRKNMYFDEIRMFNMRGNKYVPVPSFMKWVCLHVIRKGTKMYFD